MIIRRSTLISAAALLAVGLVVVGVVVSRGQPYEWRHHQGWWRGERPEYEQADVVRANTPIEVRLDSRISTEDSRQGDVWTGRMSRDVLSRDGVAIPAGAQVEGVVTTSMSGGRDHQAELGLAVREVTLNGEQRSLNADTEPLVAGSNRAKQIGAIAGGALIGEVVGHEIDHRHGGLIGALLGGYAGHRLTRHAFRTLELKPGTEIEFRTTEDLYASR